MRTSALNVMSAKRMMGATMTTSAPCSCDAKRRSISVPPRSAIETGVSAQVGGTRNE